MIGVRMAGVKLSRWMADDETHFADGEAEIPG